MRNSAVAALVVAAALTAGGAACSGGSGEPTAVPTPATYEEVERALMGRWRITTPLTDVGGFYNARELVFGPNRVWVTPTFRDFGGRYTLQGTSTIRLRHDGTDTEAVWTYLINGDTLILSDNTVTVQYARVVPLTP